jgi:hypothetical protein
VITIVSGPAGATPAASSAALTRARSSRATSHWRMGAVLATMRIVTSRPDSSWAPHTSGFSSISLRQPRSVNRLPAACSISVRMRPRSSS